MIFVKIEVFYAVSKWLDSSSSTLTNIWKLVKQSNMYEKFSLYLVHVWSSESMSTVWKTRTGLDPNRKIKISYRMSHNCCI